MFIADFGSGNTCKNDIEIVKDMIDSIIPLAEAQDVVIKWQLFQDAKPNIPLKRDVFRTAYKYAKKKGIDTTASVFDLDSLNFLREFDVPFIKIANNPSLYYLARYIHDIPMMVSYSSTAEMGKRKLIHPLCCVSRYPAQIVEYEKHFTPSWLSQGISDHTEGFDLYHKYQPEILEKHYVLKHDKANLDGGKFAMTPDDISELL